MENRVVGMTWVIVAERCNMYIKCWCLANSFITDSEPSKLVEIAVVIANMEHLLTNPGKLVQWKLSLP